jgi:hypothetical protein
MNLILVCGPWSSGTTVVSAMLDRLGARGLPPYFGTNDPRTPNSLESRAFRELVGELADESTLRMRVDWPVAQERLAGFRARLEAEPGNDGSPLFLKYPLATLMIPAICTAFPTRLVYALRPLAAIEATRVRRGWPAQFGAAGAGVLYPRMFEALVEWQFPTLIVRYDELQREPAQHAQQLAAFCGLPADEQRIATAASIVRGSNGA